MMKKALVVFVLAGFAVLTGCGEHFPAASLVDTHSYIRENETSVSSVETDDADAGSNTMVSDVSDLSSVVGMPSPVSDVTLEDIRKEEHLSLDFPVEMRDIHKIDGSPVIYEMSFGLDDWTYTLRFARTETLKDISGMFYDWTRSTEEDAEDQLYSCKFTDSGQGICLWKIGDYSLNLCMEEKASEEAFNKAYWKIANSFQTNTALSLPFSVTDIKNVDMYHYDSVPVEAEKKGIDSDTDFQALYDRLNGLTLQDDIPDDTAGSDVISFRFHLSDGTAYTLIYSSCGSKKGRLLLPVEGCSYSIHTDLTGYWDSLAQNISPVATTDGELPEYTE